MVYGFLRKIFHFAAIFSALKSLLETVVEAAISTPESDLKRFESVPWQSFRVLMPMALVRTCRTDFGKLPVFAGVN